MSDKHDDDQYDYFSDALAVSGVHLATALLEVLSNRIGFDFTEEVRAAMLRRAETFESGSEEDKKDSVVIREFADSETFRAIAAGAPPPAR